MRNKRKGGFSLIELLVVIAIIGIIAAIAVPAYVTYSIRTKIAESMVLVEPVINSIMATYSKTGAMPTTLTVNGITMTPFAWTIINYGSITCMAFSRQQHYLTLQTALSGLEGIPGYTHTAGSCPGNASNLTYGVKAVNGIIMKGCGPFIPPTSNATDIPTNYLPSACNIPSIADWVPSSG